MEKVENLYFHKTLASYFTSKHLYLDEHIQKKPNTRKLVEQPWQQTKGEMWDEVTNTLGNLNFIDAKVTSNLFDDLLNDYAYINELIKSIITLQNEIKAKLTRCITIGKTLSDIQDQIEIDLNSIGAQILLGLQETKPLDYETIYFLIANQLDNKTWIYRNSVSGRLTSKYLAQIGLNQKYIHSLNFSNDSSTIIYFDLYGRVTRWNWNSPNTSFTEVPDTRVQGFRYAALVSNKSILVMCKKELWALEIDDIWNDNLALGIWRKIYISDSKGKLNALSSSNKKGCIMLAEEHPQGNRILVFDSQTLILKDNWRIPYPENDVFINHIAVNNDGTLQAVCYGDGYIAVNNGFLCKAHLGGTYECIFLDSANNEFASCGADEELSIWEANKGIKKRIKLIHGKADCLAYNERDNLFAIGHRNGVVSMIKISNNTYTVNDFCPGISGWVLSLQFSQCFNFLAVGGRDGTLRIFKTIDLASDRNTSLFQQLPQGPIQKSLFHNPTSGIFFQDFNNSLYGNTSQIDSKFLPQACHSFCISEISSKVILASWDNIMTIDPISGKPEFIHKMPEAKRLEMAVSSDEKQLAIIETNRIVIYSVNDWGVAPTERISIPLEKLLKITGKNFLTLRSHLPIMFCQNNELLVFSLESELTAEMNENNFYYSPVTDHALCFIKTINGEFKNFVSYDGICNFLIELPKLGEIALGFGTGQILIRNKESYVSDTLQSKRSGVLFLSIDNPKKERWYDLPPEDDGVNTLDFALDGYLMSVGTNRGRIRLISTSDTKDIASVSLSDPIINCQFIRSTLFLECMDNGHANGNWPVKHQFIVNFPIE
jgi:WD40 repeat protein